jgi:hypothetical protein
MKMGTGEAYTILIFSVIGWAFAPTYGWAVLIGIVVGAEALKKRE